MVLSGRKHVVCACGGGVCGGEGGSRMSCQQITHQDIICQALPAGQSQFRVSERNLDFHARQASSLWVYGCNGNVSKDAC